MSAVGVIFSNVHDRNVPELSRMRTMGSLPYGGRYRLIDFSLSNLVNSGVSTVGIITKNNYQSLMDHLGSGKDWDLARKSGGLVLLPPFGAVDNDGLYKNRLEALKGITGFLNRRTEDYVILCDCDGVYRMDLSEVLDFHEEKGADITFVCHSEAIENSSGIPRCSCGGMIKPDVVLYEEGLDMDVLNRAVNYISRADVLIVGGTSLTVYPAARLIDYYRGHKLVLINRDATALDSRADLVISGKIGEVLGEACGL